MSNTNQFQAIRSQIARSMEHTANISTDVFEAVDAAAHRICQSFAAGGKLLALASQDLDGLTSIFHYELVQQYKDDQPSLPIVLLQPFACDQPVSQQGLHEARTLAMPQDCLLLIGNVDTDETHKALAMLANHRDICIITLGHVAHGVNQSEQTGNTQTPSDDLISVGINTGNIYSQRELSLFLLHCISDRIQAILFRGEV